MDSTTNTPTATDLAGMISQSVRDLPPSGIRKFFDYAMGMDNVISLGVGEPDYSSPWAVREAAIYSLERGQTSYTSNRGMPKLCRAVAEYLDDRWGVSHDPETEIAITVGVSQGIDIALRAILNPGDEVIIPEPCYVSYKPMALLAGGVPVTMPTYAADDFAPDIDALAAKITPRTKAILFNYPNNPTGSTLRRADLERLVELAHKHNLLLFSDEVYAELNYGEPHIAIASIPGARERTVTLSGFSKAWAMTGWRMGYLAGPEPIISAAVKIHQYSMLCAPIMSQMAALEALKSSGMKAIDPMRRSYEERRNVIVEGFRRLGLACNMPHGAFYVFPSVRETGMSADDFAWGLLEKYQVALVPGRAFGECGVGHIRCSYATSIEEIHEALNRIEDFLKSQ